MSDSSRYRYVLRKRVLLRLLFLLLFPALSACGAGKGGGGSETSGAGGTDAGDGWKTAGFAMKNFTAPPGVDWEGAFHEVRFSQKAEADPGFDCDERQSLAAYLREARYELISYVQGGESRLFLERQVSDIEEAQRTELFAGEGRKPKGRAACLDAVTEADIAVLFLEGPAGEEQYRILHMDGEGNVLSESDVTAGYRERGVTAEDLRQGSWWCDGQGYSYALSGERLLAFDAEGAFVMSSPCKTEQEGELAELYAPTAFHAPDGSPVFAMDPPDGGGTQLVRLDLTKKQAVTLASLGEPCLRQFMMTEDGAIYYTDSRWILWRWDTRTGEREALFSCTAEAVLTGTLEHVSVTAEGELLLYMRSRAGIDLYALSDAEQPETGGIRLVTFTVGVTEKMMASEYNRTAAGECKVNCAALSEDSWGRIGAEIAAGKGPDLISLFANDDRIGSLYEKGALADLSDYIQKETLEQMLPGLLVPGTMDDGTLAGLTITYGATTIVVPRQLWDEDSWTLEDILGIIENTPDLEGIYCMPGYYRESPAFANLNFLALSDLESSPFVDLEKGESHFESELFQKVLEVSKKYVGVNSGNVKEMVREGKCIAVERQEMYSAGFGQIIDDYGEGTVRFMGYPGQPAYKGNFHSGQVLLVNANTEHPEEVAAFLNFLWIGKKAPGEYSTMREDALKAKYESYTTLAWDSPEEGDRYARVLREYTSCMLHMGYAKENRAIRDIVEEESGAYFSGDRDAARTAQIIDNRVQLYLDERK